MYHTRLTYVNKFDYSYLGWEFLEFSKEWFLGNALEFLLL